MTEKASYKQEIITLGYVHQSVETRIRTIEHFFTITQKEEIQITILDIEKYINYHINKKLHSDTITSYYRAVEHYFNYLEREQIIPKNPFNYHDLNIIKNPKKEREILTQEEIQEVYKQAQKGKETIILHLCYGCGLRAKEMELLNTEDINTTLKTLTVQKGKNNKYRVVPLSDRINEDLIQYLTIRNKIQTQSKAVLLNTKNKRLRRYTALVIMQKIVKRTAITQNITLHGLRHSIATHLLENGLPINQVQEFLGHSQMETTEIYTRITKFQLKKL